MTYTPPAPKKKLLTDQILKIERCIRDAKSDYVRRALGRALAEAKKELELFEKSRSVG